MLPFISSSAIPGRSDVTLLARIAAGANALITQSTLASIGYWLTDLTTGTVLQSNVPLTIASVVFNALQFDGTWTKDGPANLGPDGRFGYNFKATIPASQFTTPGDRFQLDCEFVTTAGAKFTVSWIFNTVKVFGT